MQWLLAVIATPSLEQARSHVDLREAAGAADLDLEHRGRSPAPPEHQALVQQAGAHAHGEQVAQVVKTERTGSRQTLVCRKTRERYVRQCNRHAEDVDAMRALLALERRTGRRLCATDGRDSRGARAYESRLTVRRRENPPRPPVLHAVILTTIDSRTDHPRHEHQHHELRPAGSHAQLH